MHLLFLNIVFASGALVLFGGWSESLAKYTFPVYYIFIRDMLLVACLISLILCNLKTKHLYPFHNILIGIFIVSFIFFFKLPYDFMGVIHFGYRNLVFWLTALFIFSVFPIKNYEKLFDRIFWTTSIYVSASLLFFNDFDYFGRNIGFMYNPNIAGNISILAVFFHVLNLLNKKQIFINIVFGISSLCAFVLTGSFTAFLMFVVLAFYALFLGFSFGRFGIGVVFSFSFVSTILYFCFQNLSFFDPLKERIFHLLNNNPSTVEARFDQYFQLGQYYDVSSFEWLFGIRLREPYRTYDTFYVQILENHGMFGILGVISVFWILGNLLMQSLERYKQVYSLRVVMIVHLVIGWFFTNVGLGFFANSFVTKFPFNAFFALLIGLTLSILAHDLNLHLKIQPKKPDQ